jgi:dsRNA-specific ribonuclease
VLLIADQLCQTIIKDVPVKDIHHMALAICATSAHWVTDYQRYEFLGDSILKFIVSIQLFVDHENWHEGYLTERRASLVSNPRLTKAALDVGLDAFILTKSFANRRWPHPMVSDLAAPASGRRSVSSKTLADVVEALIGAAFIDGGLPSARACIHAFLPDIHIQAPTFGLATVDDPSRRANSTITWAHGTAELLIGYRFLNKALLEEALTHPSCERDTFTESYQRLEFLGDAVLDIIVVPVLFEHKSDYSHGEMTSIKAALVNAELLAFLCMEYSLVQDTVDIQQKNIGRFCEVHGERQIELWKFMRHHSPDIIKAQQACLKRLQKLRRDVQHCLKKGKSYPWTLLAELNADKFYSDMVESVLGAIFVDSKGNLEQCQHFAERIGILPYLRRILVEGIDIVHPKTRLGRLTAPDKIEYVVDCEENVHSVYRCLVKVNDKDVTTVGGCLSRDEAMVKAAHAAIELISRAKPEASDRLPQDRS